MPGKHKNKPTIAFQSSDWVRALIDQRAALSGIYKKDFITRSAYIQILSLSGQKRIYRE